MRILIADDNETSSKLLRAVLEAEGHATLTAADGREALGLLEGNPVDAIISDLLMPNLDGYRLCREVRRQSRWQKVPFICYTAIYCSLDDEKLAFDLGADAYLRKPAPNATILSTLRTAVDKARSGPSRRKRLHTELDVLNEYSQPLVTELENKNVELSGKSRLADLALEVAVALARRSDLGEILQTCCESMLKHLDAALARIWTLDNRNDLELRASASTDQLPQGVPFGQGLVRRIAREKRPLQGNSDLSEFSVPEQAWARRQGVEAFTGHPLIVEERLLGVVAVFTNKNLPAATITSIAAIAGCLALGIQGKLAEIVQHESEGRFRQLAENISEVFWMTDLTNEKVLYVSPAYETIWGRTCRSLLQRHQSLFESVHPDDRARVLAAIIPKATAPYEIEYRIVRPDGSIRWIRDRAFPVRDAAGVVIRMAGLAEDVTEKRELEAQLFQSQKMEAIGRLAGGVAHDFNNLLSVIFGHSELLAASSPSPEQLRDSVAEINQAAERAAALTRQLLAFGRRQVVEPKVLDLGTVLSESQNLLRRLIGEDVRLKIITGPGPRMVSVDPSQINQVLINLAVNARDAMPRGGELTIEIRNVEFQTNPADASPERLSGRYVLLSVTDTGSGMTPEVQSRIFEPFFSTKPENTGLGLSVVDGIIKQSGGQVSVTSRSGVGTTFSIYLAAVDGEAEPLAVKPVTKPLPGHETVLLVEDEDPVREVTALLLESLGYEVLQVSNAEPALELVRNARAKIDLLLTDVIMPGMSGRELAEACRVLNPGIKVLFQSGYTEDIIVRHGILHAEVAFLHKPFTLETLAKRIRDLLEEK